MKQCFTVVAHKPNLLHPELNVVFTFPHIELLTLVFRFELKLNLFATTSYWGGVPTTSASVICCYNSLVNLDGQNSTKTVSVQFQVSVYVLHRVKYIRSVCGINQHKQNITVKRCAQYCCITFPMKRKCTKVENQPKSHNFGSYFFTIFFLF